MGDFPPLFLLWCRSRRMWWVQNEHGYTSKLADAGRFDPTQLSRIMVRGDGDDFPMPAEFVEVIEAMIDTRIAAADWRDLFRKAQDRKIEQTGEGIGFGDL